MLKNIPRKITFFFEKKNKREEKRNNIQKIHNFGVFPSRKIKQRPNCVFYVEIFFHSFTTGIVSIFWEAVPLLFLQYYEKARRVHEDKTLLDSS